MKKLAHYFKKYFLLLSFCALLIASACKKDDDNENPPVLPPQSSFVFDMSTFPTQKKAADIFALAKANFGYVYVQVVWWHTFVSLAMLVPTASFVEAFNHEPVKEAPGWWIWSYNFKVNNITYTASLNGKIVGSKVLWEMYISVEGVVTDFLWYTGESNLDGTAGIWTIYKAPEDPVQTVGIAWNRDITSETGEIKFTNIITGDANYGSYIHFGLTEETEYNAFYTINLTSIDKMTEIEWNTVEYDGHVKDTTHFHDEEWHCWDVNLNDISCN